MQEILKKLNELIGICETRIKKCDAEKGELAALRSNLENQKSQQKARQDEIDADNAALNKRKAIAKTLDEAQAIFKENNNEKKRLKVESENLEKQKAEHTKKVADDNADIKRKMDKAAAIMKETEKKAENYKVEVMNTILKEAAAKSKADN